MTKLAFTKFQTIGNDFVTVHQSDVVGLDLPALAVQLCRRHFSIGADGLLVVQPDPRGLRLRMFNPDGTEDFCGNGLRCAGWLAHQSGWVGDTFEIEHGGRWIPATVRENGVSVILPPASFEPDLIPINGDPEQLLYGIQGTAVSTGSTHFVAFCDALPQDEEFFQTSPLIEHAAMFPERTSVMYTQVLSPRHLKLRIWERGAGETLGCGTGSVAAAVVWSRRSGETGEITVTNPGGDLLVHVDHWTLPVRSTSRPAAVFQGEVCLPVDMLTSRATLV